MQITLEVQWNQVVSANFFPNIYLSRTFAITQETTKSHVGGGGLWTNVHIMGYIHMFDGIALEYINYILKLDIQILQFL